MNVMTSDPPETFYTHAGTELFPEVVKIGQGFGFALQLRDRRGTVWAESDPVGSDSSARRRGPFLIVALRLRLRGFRAWDVDDGMVEREAGKRMNTGLVRRLMKELQESSEVRP